MDNKDYIKNIFDNDGVKAPDSLSEESIIKMLEAAEANGEGGDARDKGGKNFEPVHTRRARPALKKIASVAAAALIIFAGIGGYNSFINTAPDTSVKDGSLYTFGSELQVRRMVNSLNRSSLSRGLDMGSSGNFMTKDLAVSEDTDAYESEMSAEAPMAVSNSAPQSESHSDTYRQEDEVDEADIVKTDGKYIYYVNSAREVVILSAKDGRTKKLSTIGNSGVENYIEDIYVKGDRLITVGTFYRDDSDESESGIVIYDISDRSRPEYVSDYSQSGSIVTSRMVGDFVYLVTNDYVYKGGRCLPFCGSSGALSPMPVSDICCMPDPQSSSYIILSGIDTTSGKNGRCATKAVFGASSDVYCNDHNLYAAAWEYDSKTDTAYTRIVRAALDGINVKFNTTAKVRGNIYGQFAMDERDGYFRIATTANRNGIDVNNLFVLDADLKECGKITGFARNESIKAVRFIGSKAYVITYEAIDPLFIIDLSDPASPRIEGEVKIDGFSSLLVPVSGSRLLGIGYATGDNGYGGEYASGLKLALFDISDPSGPKVIDSREFKDMNSPAQYNHHALTVNQEAGWYAVPYEVYTNDENNVDVIDDLEPLYDDAEEPADTTESGNDTSDADTGETYTDDDTPYENMYENGVLVFRAGDSINSVDQHKLDSGYINRCVYIGEWIYALDESGNVSSFKVAD